MEGQSSAGNSQYRYPSQSAQWSRLVRRNTVADPARDLSSDSTASPALHLPGLLPILLPQHSSYHQAQLAQYNRLITSGRASASPLPPIVSAQNIQGVSGHRSNSSGGNTTRASKSTSRVGHGNKESRKSSKGEHLLIAEKDKPATMPAKKLELANQLPHRPTIALQATNISQQSSSVPSTPHQHARKFSFTSREPSPDATNHHSPRSAYSESNLTLTSARPLPAQRGGCRYETAMAHTKRRMPYSIGSEKLEKLNPTDVKSKLSEDEERKLTTDMRELYDRLLPTAQSDGRRLKLVEKLEKLFNDEWPGHNIRVHVFGSSGNLLCTDESDVDICITTDWKELEGVCMIADLLAKNGMQRVICVSTAKVPIVKIWDPELCLACDMNVNNTLALENTRMIKIYVEIDPRVRPLAMIVKHWTKRRIVNDAAFGGTLSSYTWICMIIYFLQTRNTPVLPALHQRPHIKTPVSGSQAAFADDLDTLQGFGKRNKESLGQLLFCFFRFYGHEFDYDKYVISVRNGKQISKVEKKWQLANNNGLCVEEPFNTNRNLGNTADDTSFRGLHMEMRRAFDLVSKANLEECCEQFHYPKEEERVWERPPPKPRPVLRSTSQSNRGGRNGNNRGARQNNQHNRNGNNNRRASSAGFDGGLPYMPQPLPRNMTAQDIWLQQQAQAQLHNDLFATYSVLQAQENNLRLQLYNQSQGFLQAQQNQGYPQSPSQSSSGTVKQQATDRNRTSSFDQPPLTAPLRQDMYFYPTGYTTPVYTYQTPSTNPSSPSLSSAMPELRRSMHRSSVANGSGPGGQSSSSPRSHSQPAVRSASTQLSLQSLGVASPGLGIYQSMRQANGIPIPNFIADENLEHAATATTSPPEDTTPKEYVGYYFNNPGPSTARRESLAIPAFGDLAQNRRRLSTDQLPQSILDRLKRPSRSPSPLGHDRSYSTGAHSTPIMTNSSQHGISSTGLRTLNTQAPLVVNGSNVPTPVSIPNWQASVHGASTTDDHASDVAVGSMDSASQMSGTPSEKFESDQDYAGLATPKDSQSRDQPGLPCVVNGSSSQMSEISALTGLSLDGVATGLVNGLAATDSGNIPPRLSPNSRNRMARQNGGMSPLDIGAGHNDGVRDDLPHLSPVYETRTPSPTANRKFEAGLERKAKGLHSKVKDEYEEVQSFKQKTAHATENQAKQTAAVPKVNGHTRASKSEGGGPGIWQKIPKGKKKGPGAESKNSPSGQLYSEKLPSIDSERKGG
ncbi:PAP substrate-binding protein [Venustampulla echinocandica]|uniref:polynucleotide adenylyltransferase n=1 Tax=Venustampulla echinocandica TaxID=2656787 RepID=A0A370U1D4_9HELO|nr:PAP substrate-binding protein [Venustampulla echinocandica]RDL41590.1 PAP substrate-binding protein [Venustampulla echinocandica]